MSVLGPVSPRRVAGALAVLFLLRAVPAWSQQVPNEEQERKKRLGFYFSIAMQRMGVRSFANGLAVEVDPPTVLGSPFPVVGPQRDATFDDRSALGFTLGFRLRNDNGWIEGDFYQWDQRENLLTEAAPGKVLANTLASPEAGFFEDQGNTSDPNGGPDGLVVGFEGGSLAERTEQPDGNAATGLVLDGAEDINYNRTADFIRFDTSQAIVGLAKTDFQRLDVEYGRRIKRLRRFELQGLAGLRLASVRQDLDMAYRQLGAFAVYIDDEGCTGDCRESTREEVLDGDGDGDRSRTTNEPDGDGFMNGDGDVEIRDRLEHVETVSEDRIVASMKASGVGLKLGVRGVYEVGRKWRLRGGIAVSLMATDTAHRYRETFVSERDRFPNFIDWDLNGDGFYNNLDFDFDGDCLTNPDCDPPDANDQAALTAAGGEVETSMRVGVENSVVDTPRGVRDHAYDPVYGNYERLRTGDPVPESERNTDILRETSLIHDVAGTGSGLLPMLDLELGAEYQFSRFAHVGFGLHSTRWFDAGRFRSLANDVIGGGGGDLTGDFALDGWYVNLTIVPR